LKALGFYRKIEFCVSDEKEKGYVQINFPRNEIIWVGPNLPNIQTSEVHLEKILGFLRMITVELINPIKNHLIVVKALKHLSLDIQWDTYGPTKDAAYWEACQSEINHSGMRAVVNYCGVLNADCVNETVSKYHVMVQPSESENFGLSLIQGLYQLRHVITIHYSLRNGLEQATAGFNVKIDKAEIANAIEQMVWMDQLTFNSWSNGAFNYASKAVRADEIVKQYQQMFN
jgi:glycosyltransferase involved in cell wall biosynthesis